MYFLQIFLNLLPNDVIIEIVGALALPDKTHRKSRSALHPEIWDNSRFVSMAFQQAYRAWLILFQLKLQK